jgi:phosphopantetheinyl transferase
MTARPVVVHLAAIDDDRWDPEKLLPRLGEVERSRAATFRRPTDRARYIVAHALLDLAVTEAGFRDPRTSLAHAGDLVAVAIAEGIAVGIDVEPVDARRGDDAVAARYFAPDDRHALAMAGPIDRRRTYARGWTRLEAEAKGRGVSLDGLRGRPRSGHFRDIEAGPGHVVTLWTAGAAVLVRVDRRLLASVA